MSDIAYTTGELLFTDYLNAMQYPYEFEKKYPSRSKENAVARIPLSRKLFTGPFDERWGCENGYQSIVFRGDKLAALGEEG